MATRHRIAAVGAGRMGRGIAHVFAYAGHPVSLIDFKPRAKADMARLAKAAKAEIAGNLKFLSRHKLLTAGQVAKVLDLIEVIGVDEAPRALAEAALIWEGVPETMAAKEDALGRMSALARPDAILASTTSTILTTELARFVRHPARFLNAHFLNPAFLIPLVEVMPGPDTDPKVTRKLVDRLEAVGKVPVQCKASPGYILPRLQSLLLSEAARMVHEGVATAEDIDKSVMFGFGPRYSTMGPIEFIDWGGVDILYYAGNYLAKALNSPRHAPPPEVDQMMKDGRRGMREGRGYYDFTKMDVGAYQRAKLARFVKLLHFLGQMPKPGVPNRPARRTGKRK
jgi:3-hydroxybutyryl-CoA dehydrogenase